MESFRWLRRSRGSSDFLQFDVLFFGVALTIATTVVAPVLGVVVFERLLGFPIPVLFGLAFVVGLYSTAVLLTREWIRGGLIALIVFALFGADVPLLASSNHFHGNIVGELLLIHGPIVALLAVVWWKRVNVRPVSFPTYTLGAFVLWSVVAALFGGGPNTGVALWFSFFAACGWVVFVLLQETVRKGWLRFQTVVSLVVIGVAGHTAVGVAQLVNQGGFGLTQLGEGGDFTIAVLTIPGAPSIHMGTFVSGFTGMSFQLANLLVLTIPVLLVFVYRSRRTWQAALLGGWTVVSFVVVRATTTDAGRGGLVIALACQGLLVVYVFRPSIAGAVRRVRIQSQQWSARSFSLLSPIVGMAAVMYPSSMSSSSSLKTDVVIDGTQATMVGNQLRERRLVWLSEYLRSSSIPLVDLSNLGVRIQQYVLGLELFLYRPLFGLGAMNYVLVAEQYGIVPPPGNTYPLPIHNVYITLLVETGIVGCLLYVGTFLLVGVYAFRLLSVPGSDRLLIIAVVSGIAGSLAFGFWDVLQLYYGSGFFPLWLLAGALVGEYRRSVSDGRPKAQLR